MAFARDSYSATGGQTDFTITFDYLLAAHVVVTDDGVTLTNAAGAGNYTIVSTTTVRLGTAASASDRIVITRSTSQATALVDFTVPSTLVEADLDENAKQMLFMAQEAIDIANNSITFDTTDNFTASSKRIKDLATPTATTDATTKAYVDAIVAAAGAVPTPADPGDDSKALTASGGTFAWNVLGTAGGGTGAITAAAALTALAAAGTGISNTFTKTQIWLKGADVTAANALLVGIDGNWFDVSGNTAITSMATKGVGTFMLLEFDGTPTITHHASDLILPGATNITASAGSIGLFYEYATADWRLISYVDGNGDHVAVGSETWLQGADVTAATDTLIGIDGNLFDVTGNTTIATLATKGIGTFVVLQFDGTPTLTHSANLVLPGAIDIAIEAGDVCIFYEYASADWRLVSHINGATRGRFPKPDFTSAETSLNNDAQITFAHGLGAVPSHVEVILRANTATAQGWADNEEMVATFPLTGISGAAESDYGNDMTMDATNVYITQGEFIQLVDHTSFDLETITQTEYDWVVRAWK